ncbi:hypothetical protein ACFQU2_18000 [Siccirubricoccus deserti]
MAKPPQRRAVRKGAPPLQDDTLGALGKEPAPRVRKGKDKEPPVKAPAKERTEPLNFRVTPDFRRAFKRAAAAQDCKKVELLERIFAEWSARNPA